MRTTRIALLTGTAAIILAGVAGIAKAQTPDARVLPEAHVLTVRLPDGRLEQIRYTGNVPPAVIVGPQAIVSSFAPVSPFAMLERMSEDMEQQQAIMFRAINDMTMANAGGFGVIPAMSGPGVCMRSVRITFTGNGQAPHVMSQTAGDCGAAQGRATPATLPNAAVPNQTPRLIEARAGDPNQG